MATDNDNIFSFIDEALGNNPENDIVIPQSAQKSFRMNKAPKKEARQDIGIIGAEQPKKVVPKQPQRMQITTPKNIRDDVENYMDSNGFNHEAISGDDMFAVIAPEPEPIKPDYDPEVVSKEDVLTFDYFPDISLDEVSIKNIQHTEQSAREAVERQEQIAKSQTEEELEKTRLSIGFVLSIAGLFLFFLTIPAIVVSRSEMKRGRRKAKAGFIIGIVGLVLFIIEVIAILLFIMNFGLML